MRAVPRLLLLLSISCAAPAYSQDDEEPGDRHPRPAPEANAQQRRPGGFLGLFRGPAPLVGATPWTMQGDIDSVDGTNEDNLSYENVRVTLEADRRLRISVLSQEIDPRVEVYALGSEEMIDSNDDGGQGVNARLDFTPRQAGVHIIRVVGVLRDVFGTYQLVIEPVEPLPNPLPAVGASAGATNWTEIAGALTADDVNIEGRNFDDYQLSLSAGDEILVRLDSTEFDPLVQIYPASGRDGEYLQVDDDSGPGNSSLLLFKAIETGDYVVRVSSFSYSRSSGQYRLRIGR